MFEPQSQQLRRVTILLDAALTALAVPGSYWLRDVVADMGPPASLEAHLALLPLILPLWFFLLTFFNAYRGPMAATLLDLAWGVTRAVAAGLALLLTFLFLLKIQNVSRVIITTFALLDTLALIGVRAGAAWYARRALRHGSHRRRVLIIGSGSRAERLAEALLHNSEWGIQIAGYLDVDPMRVGRPVLGSWVLGTVDEIASVLKDQVIDEVILAIPRGMISSAEKVVKACEEEGVDVRLMADLFDVNVARMTLEEFNRIPLLTFAPVAHEEWKLLVKRIVDLAASLMAMPILLPVMGIIALAIKLDSPGPVFFVQDRVGHRKRRFRMLKFRTMVHDAEQWVPRLLAESETEGPFFKLKDDPRVTSVGRYLRKTSLDELPQLFNVLRGEMSLVGPRPVPVWEAERFDSSTQRKRFSMKPGLTCLWQISGRSALPASRRVELDLDYISRWSLWLDLEIMVKTVPAVVRGMGAF